MYHCTQLHPFHFLLAWLIKKIKFKKSQVLHTCYAAQSYAAQSYAAQSYAAQSYACDRHR